MGPKTKQNPNKYENVSLFGNSFTNLSNAQICFHLGPGKECSSRFRLLRFRALPLSFGLQKTLRGAWCRVGQPCYARGKTGTKRALRHAVFGEGLILFRHYFRHACKARGSTPSSTTTRPKFPTTHYYDDKTKISETHRLGRGVY